MKRHRKAKKGIEKHRKALKGIVKHQKASQVIKRHRKTLKNIERHRNTSQDIKTHRKTSKHIKTYQNTSKHIKTHQNTSKHIETHWNTLKHINSKKGRKNKKERRTPHGTVHHNVYLGRLPMNGVGDHKDKSGHFSLWGFLHSRLEFHPQHAIAVFVCNSSFSCSICKHKSEVDRIENTHQWLFDFMGFFIAMEIANVCSNYINLTGHNRLVL